MSVFDDMSDEAKRGAYLIKNCPVQSKWIKKEEF